MSDAIASPSRPLMLRILSFWADMRGSARQVLAEEPGEGRLLFFAMLSGLIWFLGSVASLWLDPATAAIPPDELTGRVAAAFVAAVIFRTLALYGIAGLIGLVARACGGTGTWRETRAAVFWAALVAAPLGFAATVVDGIGPKGDGISGFLLGSLAPMAFAVALSPGLAEAHGFRRASFVFACVVVVASGVVAAAWLAGGA